MKAAQAMFRQSFTDVPKSVNWFPGHMKKAQLSLDVEFAKTDLFIEVRDARIPLTSHNSELTALIPPRIKRLVVFNKIDLANENKTLALIKQI